MLTKPKVRFCLNFPNLPHDQQQCQTVVALNRLAVTKELHFNAYLYIAVCLLSANVNNLKYLKCLFCLLARTNIYLRMNTRLNMIRISRPTDDIISCVQLDESSEDFLEIVSFVHVIQSATRTSSSCSFLFSFFSNLVNKSFVFCIFKHFLGICYC